MIDTPNDMSSDLIYTTKSLMVGRKSNQTSNESRILQTLFGLDTGLDSTSTLEAIISYTNSKMDINFTPN